MLGLGRFEAGKIGFDQSEGGIGFLLRIAVNNCIISSLCVSI